MCDLVYSYLARVPNPQKCPGHAGSRCMSRASSVRRVRRAPRTQGVPHVSRVFSDLWGLCDPPPVIKQAEPHNG